VIAGDGQMGLAMAALALEAGGESVVVWGPFPEAIEDLRLTRRSPRLPGWTVPSGIECVSDPGIFAEASIAVNAIPTQFMRATWSALGPHLCDHATLVSTAKGLEASTGKRPSVILAEAIGRPIAEVALSGPTIAAELIQHLPAVMLAASPNAEAAARTADAFATPWLRIYESDDLLGVELAGALKNVIALAAGMCDGLELGSNAKSALLARGLAEMARFGVAAGAKKETFFGIAGVGDLATTCFSPQGRNRSCGEAIGRGADLETYIAEQQCVVEGVPTVKSVLTAAREYRIDMPITSAIYEILFEGTSPRDAIAQLMGRPANTEGLA
jgi:glycerol-3-phosphate dehydrogenase (NAD(P)+)